MTEQSTSAASVDSAAAAVTGQTTGAAAETTQTPSRVSVGGKEYGSWDEVGKAYESLQSEHGRWTQQYGTLKQQYEDAAKMAQQAQKWQEWWKDIQPLWGDDVEDFLRKKMEGATGGRNGRVASNQAQADAWSGWELLSPQEQAQRLEAHLSEAMQGQFTSRLTDLAKAVQDTLTQKENWYQTYLNNHLGLMRKALEQKLQNPSFDIDKTMEIAAQAIGGQIDPLKLGQQLIDAQTFQAKLEDAKKAAYEQGKRDLEQEFKNKKEEPSPAALVGGAPKFKLPGLGGETRKGLASLRESAAEQIAKRFGPQWFAR